MSEHDEYVYPGKRFTKCGIQTGHGQGMTLRDWFAGRAMTVLREDWQVSPDNYCAQRAYEMADAMLEARKQEPKP